MSQPTGRTADPSRRSRAAGARRPWCLLAAMVLLGSLPAQAAPRSLDIEGAWIREAPPGASVLGAYMTVRNRGDRADRLLRVQSPAAGRIEIHEMAVREGVMRMRPLQALAIPPGQTTVLKPKSTHLMLLDVRRPLKAGMRVPMTFVFERAGAIRQEVPVKRSD